MKMIKVTYTVQPAFASENQKNVKVFINDLGKIANPSLRYLAFLSKDGKTFNHFALYENDEAQKELFDLPSFQSFQKKRDESGLEVAPQIEELELVASSFDIFTKSV
jgi:hypothetical protein